MAHVAPVNAVPAEKEKVVALRAVKAPEPGVPPPIAPGAAKVAPPKEEAFKFATLVVEATVNGAVPVACVLVITPVALKVVNAPAAGVPPPMAPGAANVAPLNVDAFRFATLVVEATENGAVPVTNVLVICPVAEMVVKAEVPGVPPPIAPGLAKVALPNVPALIDVLQPKPVLVVQMRALEEVEQEATANCWGAAVEAVPLPKTLLAAMVGGMVVFS